MSHPEGDPGQNPNLVVPKVEKLPARELIEHVGVAKGWIMAQLSHDFTLSHGREFTERNLSGIKANEAGKLTTRMTTMFPLIERRTLGENPDAHPTGLAVVRIANIGLNGTINQVMLDKLRNGMGHIEKLQRAGKVTREVANAHKVTMRKRREAALQAVIESNNMFREVASGTNMTRRTLNALLRSVAFDDDADKAHALEAGISGEVATHKAISAAIERLQANGDDTDRSIRFGVVEEDSKGGDLVYKVGNTVVYVDSKISNHGQADAEVDNTAGYSLRPPRKQTDNYDLKLTIWPSGRDSLNEDMSYDDPAFETELMAALQEIDTLRNN